MRVLVTGASGFVGSAVATAAFERGDAVTVVSRSTAPVPDEVERLQGDFSTDTRVSGALRRCDVVIHAAARVHVMRDTSRDPLTEFRRANTAATEALATSAAESGVRRFIFLSSIKVLGEASTSGSALVASQAPDPKDPYGISKLEAEVALQRVAARTGLEVVIIRPVLVYGPGVKGNFRAMLNWLWRGIPLPLGAVRNRRSLVARDNLVDLILRASHHPRAAGATLLVSDGEDMSTPALLRRAGAALGRRARLIPVPPTLLELAGTALGRRDAVRRLTGSLQVDIAPTKALLDWTPPIGVDAALAATARAFLDKAD